MARSSARNTEQRGSRWLAELAAPHWTVLFFLLTAAAALLVTYRSMAPTALMAPPLLLLLLNLLAAILSHARFRADLPLLLFHLALLALVALLALARLIYFEGSTTLSSGTAFDGVLLTEAKGPLHSGKLTEVHFANDGFVEDQAARYQRHATYNKIRWQDATGQWHLARIGDDHPLLIQGYKIYTSPHRGFSLLLRWQPNNDLEEYGTVQLGDQLDGAFAPAMKARLPNGSEAWMMLDFKNTPAQPGRLSNTGSGNTPEHSLVLRIGDARHELRPGDSLPLPGGTLNYVQLDSWMGYTISYDPTKPWIIATVLLGMASLIAFYSRQLRRQSAGGDVAP